MTTSSYLLARENRPVTGIEDGVVRIHGGLDALPPGCLQLMADGVRESFYHSLAWYRNLTQQALAPDDQVRVYALEASEGDALAILPLRVSVQGGGLRRRRGLVSLSNYYSSLYGPNLADSGHDPERSLQRLVAVICAEQPAWDFVSLSPLSTESAVFSRLVTAFRNWGMVVQPYFCFGNWYLDVGGRTSAEYFADLPSLLRNTIKRKSKKVAGARTRIRVVSGGSDLAQAIADYEEVYAESWKVSEPYPGFIPGLIRTCSEMGWLRLGLLYVDDRPVAAQVWVVTGTTASIYKLAYKEQHASLSPGTVLTAHLMRHVIDVDRVQVVDYLTGDDPYKRDWMSHRRERWGILALNPKTLGGIVDIARHVGGRLVKSLLLRVRPR